MHAPAKPANIPVITVADLDQFDGFLFGFSTRFGTYPAQFKAFWDSTGGLWAKGTLHGKYFGIFVSTGSPNGGQEVSIRNSLSNFIHHGLIYVPLGYKNSFGQLSNLDEVHGGSPWGAGAYAGGDGSRQFSDLELEIGFIQGKTFAETLIKANGGSKAAAHTETAPVTAPVKTETTEVPEVVAEPKAVAETKAEVETKAADSRAAQQKVDTAPKKEESKKFCGICTIM